MGKRTDSPGFVVRNAVTRGCWRFRANAADMQSKEYAEYGGIPGYYLIESQGLVTRNRAIDFAY